MSENEITSGIGLRHVRVALRDDDGAIEVPSDTAVGEAYAGLQVSGARALTIAVPDPNRVEVVGDDRIYYTWQLPPTSNPTGELRVTKVNHPVIAMLTGTKQWGSPNRRKIGWATDQQGLEPSIILWGSRQVIEADEVLSAFGQKRWETYIFLNAVATPRPPTMEYQAVGEMTYSIVANDSTVDELGVSFTDETNGFTKAAFVRVVTDGRFMLDAFVGNGTEKTFELSQTPTDDSLFDVAIDGVVKYETTHWTVSGNEITFVSAPSNGAKIIVEYEY